MAGCTCVQDGQPDPDCSAHGIDAQPLPVGNSLPVIHRLVQDDLQQRLDFGTRKYGQPLQPFNGRKNLRDAYEEALDMCVYLRTELYEQEATLFERMQHGVQGGDPEFRTVISLLDPTGTCDSFADLLALVDTLLRRASEAPEHTPPPYPFSA